MRFESGFRVIHSLAARQFRNAGNAPLATRSLTHSRRPMPCSVSLHTPSYSSSSSPSLYTTQAEETRCWLGYTGRKVELCLAIEKKVKIWTPPIARVARTQLTWKVEIYFLQIARIACSLLTWKVEFFFTSKRKLAQEITNREQRTLGRNILFTKRMGEIPTVPTVDIVRVLSGKSDIVDRT